MKPDQIDPAAVNRAKAVYDTGQTAIFTAQCDPRFQYCLYVPPSISTEERVDLFVAVHGTGRTSFLEFRDGFSDFGRWRNCVILCPIFPVGVCGDGGRSGYKYMIEGDIRYDLLLLGMIEEVAAKYNRQWSKFGLFGFSGGGHFTHRFAILHPEKLWGATVGAPGSVTLLDAEKNWWVGIKDLPERFGKSFDKEAFSKVPFQMVVGDADLETWEITHKEGSRYYMPGANDAGKTRPERLKSLAKSFEAAGAPVQLNILPGVSHDRLKFLDTVKTFMDKALSKYRADEK